MTAALDYSAGRSSSRWRPGISARQIPVAATTLVWLLLVAGASLHYPHFFTVRNFTNLLADNAFRGVAAVGMTFVILSGGIDLSVGALVGFTGILIGTLMTQHGWPALAALPFALLVGILFGGAMGGVIGYLGLPPFLVTLAGMFMARGLGFMISLDNVSIDSPFYSHLADFSFNFFPVSAIIWLITLAVATFVAQQTRFGRAIYAVGGNEQSATLMGVAVPWTKVKIYAVSGFCSALAGVVVTIYKASGDPTAGVGLELEAIAAVVIGGTLLTGGVGYMLGTLVGVLIYGTIDAIINFQGNLSSYWTRIAIGVLLLAFILLQKAVQSRVGRRSHG